MVRTHGWGLKGQRLRGQAPHGHWQTLTFLAALRHDRIDAPCVLDGPINGESFKAYIEQFLVPTLKPGDIVIMDNLGSHKGHAVRRRSALSAQGFCSCRPTALTSILSNRCSPSSKRCSERPPSAASMPHGGASAPCSIASLLRNAPTTFKTPDMPLPKWKML
jgi:hypothetical protein